ncbi:hypothetical protein HYY75_04300, partial [bacterium]|nr:hypothetical protein [bacterium]
MGWGKRNKGRFFVLLCVFLIGVSPNLFGLAVEYNRNGECYLLIGDTGAYRGVYRINDPAAQGLTIGYLYDPGTSIGISVDLSRNVYTFSETVDAGYVLQPGNIKRQVVDNSVSAAQANWGYHANLHYDHRNNYGSGQAGRPVYRTTGATLSPGPGTPTTAPSPNPLPPGDTVFAKPWYEIPNGSWYSTWHSTSAVGAFSIAYKVYWDRVEGKNHTWNQLRWPNGVGPTLINDGAVAVTSDLRFNRAILNGCLDGCGGATGQSTSDAKPLYTSIAFTPAQGVNPARTYLYSREKPNGTFTIKMNNSPYAGSVIGYPADFYVAPNEGKGSRWVAVSSKDGASDWVYVLGTKVIGEWYQQATTAVPPASMNINAVSVSNQWNQKGGIVFAFDKGAGT